MQNNKNSKGGLFGDIKKFSKKLAQGRKSQKGDPLVSAGFVGYVKKVKNERGDPLETKKIRNKVAQCRKKSKGGTL